MKKLLFFLMMILFVGSVLAQTNAPFHGIEIVDERGVRVTTITSVEIYAPDTTTNAVIFSDRGLQNTITIPMTEASDNTTLVDGVFHWYGPDGYDFSITDGTNVRTNANHRTRTASEGTIWFPSFLTNLTTSQYFDAESITFGTSPDWAVNGGNVANLLQWTPTSDNATYSIGTAATGANSSFNVWMNATQGLQIDSTGPTFTWDGGIANLNVSSDFATNVNTGTSTGAVNIGNSASGAITIDGASTASLSVDGDITIDATAGSVNIVSGENAAAAINIVANNGVTETITLTNTQGTSESALNVDATAGGIDVDFATGKNMAVDGGQFIFTSNEAVAGAFTVTANTGATETIVLTNTQGTGEDAFNIDATAGGIDVDFATAKNMAVTGGQFIFTSNEDVAGAFTVTTNTGTSETIVLTNTLGEGEDAYNIDATAGGIDVDFATGKNMAITGGQFIVTSNEDVASAINLVTNTGTSETIVVRNTQGTSVASIDLGSTDGGITFNTGTGAGDGITYNGRTDSLVIIEGTANDFETSVTFTDPTADGTINFPDTADEGAAGGDMAWVADAGTTTKDASNAAIPVTDAVVLGTSGGASAWSLPDGEEGQILSVVIVTDGGEATITPDTCAGCGWATVILTADIDQVSFLYVDDTVGWIILGTSTDGTEIVAVTQ